MVYSQSGKPKKFRIILNAHLDVVEAKKEQYNPIQLKDRLYSRERLSM